MNDFLQYKSYILPFITIGKFHIKTVTTEERFTVQGDLNVWWVRNRFTDQHQAGHGRLFVPAVGLVPTRVVHTDVASAVQHLQGSWVLERDEVWSVRQHNPTSTSTPGAKSFPTPQGDSDKRWLEESSVLLLTPHILGWVHSPTPSSALAEATPDIAAFLWTLLSSHCNANSDEQLPQQKVSTI